MTDLELVAQFCREQAEAERDMAARTGRGEAQYLHEGAEAAYLNVARYCESVQGMRGSSGEQAYIHLSPRDEQSDQQFPPRGEPESHAGG